MQGEVKRKPGRPRGKSQSRQVKFTLPQHHYDHLQRLALVEKRFGDTANEAAKFLLIRELDAMEQASARSPKP